MQKLHTPAPEHLHFDAMCAQVDDFEPLPTVQARQPADSEDQSDAASTALDHQILAGLVAPF